MNGDLGLPDRFWSKVDKDGPINSWRPKLGKCWVWTGATTVPPPLGYGRLYFGKVGKLAHRLAYEAVHGSIPTHLEIDHLCRNRLCVRPSHLEAVTDAINVQRGYADREKSEDFVRRDFPAYRLAWQREHAKDPEWRARRAITARIRYQERYHTDPEFRERIKAKARATHARKKEQRAMLDEQSP